MEPFAKHLSSNAQEVHQVLHKSREPFVRSNFFINLLQSALPIHFGHHVDEKRQAVPSARCSIIRPCTHGCKRTFRPHNAWQPSVPGQQVIKNQRASFAVGSDGTFSDSKSFLEVDDSYTNASRSPMASGEQARKILSISFSHNRVSCISSDHVCILEACNQCLVETRQMTALVAQSRKQSSKLIRASSYASTVVIPHEEFLKNILPYLEQGTFANLERGGALLHVVVVRVYAEHDDNYEPTGHRFAHIRISYSRTASSDGWAAFYGHA